MVRENIEKWSKKEWYPREKKRNGGRCTKRCKNDISGLVGKIGRKQEHLDKFNNTIRIRPYYNVSNK